MLQTLSDFFLLISANKNVITSKDLSIFYNFITKKMPQIQQQNPSLISDLLLTEDNENIGKKNFKDYADKRFLIFQKQTVNLINEFIDYCYNEKIIKLSTCWEELIKKRVNEKTDNNKNINEKIKEGKRNFILFLIINEHINFEISPHIFTSFFNSENRIIIRNNIENFVKYIKSLTQYYRMGKKCTKEPRKKIKKSNTHIMKEIKNHNNTNNTNKSSKTSKTGKINKSNYSSKQSELSNSLAKKKNSLLNGQQKILSTIDINDSENFIKSKISKKISGNLKNMQKKLKFNEKFQTVEDDADDTFLCDTPNNISSCDKKIIDEINSQKRMSLAKQSSPKHLNKENISSTSYNKFINSKTISTNGATDGISCSEQKENQNPTDFPKKLNKIKEIVDNENDNITISNLENKNNTDINNKINDRKKNKPKRGYNKIESNGVNEKNENYKELFVYKNFEMHQHLVEFDNKNNNKKDVIEEDEIIGCTLF